MTVPFTKIFNPGEILTASDVNEHLLNGGYQFRETVYFTSSGTFVKADYPWLRAIRVKCQGGGGGGSGIPNTTGARGGGAGGGYAESFITDIAGLDASVTVTRGAGGAGGSFGSGSTGGASSFGALVIGNGGIGGQQFEGGSGGSGTGNLIVTGGGGSAGVPSSPLVNGMGGGSHLGGNTRSEQVGANNNGLPGVVYGGGGGGAARTTTGNSSGGAGANGIVIVELYG
jgi:hypothetical protein